MITLAGQPLLLPDSEGELLRWQEAFQSSEYYNDFCEPSFRNSSRYATRYSSGKQEASYGVGIPIPPFTAAPTPQINQLYWPTGAGRWARGYFMATAAAKTAIAAQGFGAPLTLEIKNSDETSGSLTIKVYALAPRPMTVLGTNAADQLWLIPIVDARYFWNQQQSGDLDPDSFVSWGWTELFSYLATAAGASTSGLTASGNYLKPDKTEFTRRHDNTAALLDAAATSCGRRIAAKFGNTQEAEAAATSRVLALQRFNYDLIAGGRFNQTAPGGIVVVFTKRFRQSPEQIQQDAENLPEGSGGGDEDTPAELPKIAFSPNATADKYTISITAPSSVIPSTQYQSIHSAAFADYENEYDSESGGDPINKSRLQSLANQIVQDYYAWQTFGYDITFAGINNTLKPCGFDDYILISFGTQRHNEESGEYELNAVTRIVSYPANFFIEQQLSQDEPRKCKLVRYDVCGEERVEIQTIFVPAEFYSYLDHWVKVSGQVEDPDNPGEYLPAADYCWLVQERAADGSEDDEDETDVTLEKDYGTDEEGGCEACENPVWSFTICGTEDDEEPEIIYAAEAETGEAVEIDLEAHENEIARIEDGRCAVQSEAMALPDGETLTTDLVILDYYEPPDEDDDEGSEDEPCGRCVITKLVNCNDEEDVIYTYSDLSDFTDDDYIQDADSDPIECYQKDHSEDPIAWDAMDPPVKFNPSPKKPFSNCDECRGEVIYRGTQDCTPDECDPAKAEEMPDIVTADTNLAGFSGKYGKVEGIAYSWVIDEAAVEGDITDETVDVVGPFNTCEEALAAPVSGRIPTLRKVTISDENVPRWHVNAFIFNDSGELVGVCPEIVTGEGTECSE